MEGAVGLQLYEGEETARSNYQTEKREDLDQNLNMATLQPFC
jgi:hypothetical protein